MRYEVVHLGKIDGSIRKVRVPDFLLEITSLSTSEFWSQTLKHREEAESRKRESMVDVAGTFNKRHNVYYQSFSQQFLFLSIGCVFASTGFLVEETVAEPHSAFCNVLFGLLFFGIVLFWYGLYGVTFEHLRKAYGYVNKVTSTFRASTTLLQATQLSDTFENNERTLDEDFFDFENEANLEMWYFMHEHIQDACKIRVASHNTVIALFVLYIVLGAIALVVLSFLTSIERNSVIFVNLFLLELLLVGTLLKHTTTAATCNENFHHRTLMDLRKIVFHKTQELNELLYRAENEEEGLKLKIARKRKCVSNLNAVIIMIKECPKLPGVIMGFEIKKELIAKVVLAVVASCASALLRLGLT